MGLIIPVDVPVIREWCTTMVRCSVLSWYIQFPSGSSMGLPIIIRRHSPLLLFSGCFILCWFPWPCPSLWKNPFIKLSLSDHFSVPSISCYSPNWRNHWSSMLVVETSLQQRVASPTRSQRPLWSKGPRAKPSFPSSLLLTPKLPRKDPGPGLPTGTSCTCLRDTHTHTHKHTHTDIPPQPKKKK